MSHFKSLTSAPKTGEEITLKMEDATGSYTFTCSARWDEKREWVNARTGHRITAKIIAWKRKS